MRNKDCRHPQTALARSGAQRWANGWAYHARRVNKIVVSLTHVESAPLGATMELRRSHVSHQGAALMKRTVKYVGLDVHQATIVASVREPGGRVIARTILPTEERA